MSKNIFEAAARIKLRFATSVGNITVEDLWGLPLASKTKLNINDIAKGIAKKIRDSDEDNFVGVKSSDNEILELKLDIIKHVIKVRQDENATRKSAIDNKAKKEKILAVLAKRQDDALEGKSEEELLEELKVLG